MNRNNNQFGILQAPNQNMFKSRKFSKPHEAKPIELTGLSEFFDVCESNGNLTTAPLPQIIIGYFNLDFNPCEASIIFKILSTVSVGD